MDFEALVARVTQEVLKKLLPKPTVKIISEKDETSLIKLFESDFTISTDENTDYIVLTKKQYEKLSTGQPKLHMTTLEETRIINAIDLTNKKVIQEKDVKNAVYLSFSEILVNKNAIITPLARDYINEKSISVQKQKNDET